MQKRAAFYKGLLFLLLISLIACNSKHHLLAEKIAGCDSVAINFFKGDGQMDTVTKVLIVKDPAVVKKIAGYVCEDKEGMKANCGVGGSLHFFKFDKVIQDVYFTPFNSDCNLFSFKLDGQNETTRLSKEAKNTINQLGGLK
jgi:hypothetical protein